MKLKIDQFVLLYNEIIISFSNFPKQVKNLK